MYIYIYIYLYTSISIYIYVHMYKCVCDNILSHQCHLHPPAPGTLPNDSSRLVRCNKQQPPGLGSRAGSHSGIFVYFSLSLFLYPYMYKHAAWIGP